MAGLKINKDLDLRRYGKNLYTKALKNGGGGNSEGGEGTIDYEDIYQFYKQQFLSLLPPETTETMVLPEHLENVVACEGIEYESGTAGIWSTDNFDLVSSNEVDILFPMLSDESTTFIVFGEYRNTTPSIG